MTTAPERLKTVGRAYRLRGDARTVTDISYTVYVAVLVVLIVGFPLVRAVVVLLAEPVVLSGLQAPAASRVVSIVCGLLLAGFAAFGQVRGPVALSPFFVTLLARIDLPRSQTLSRPFAMTTAIVLTVSLAVGILFSSVLVFAGTASFVSGLLFVIGCASFSLIGCFVWVTSQRTIRRSWILPVGLLAMTVASAAFDPFLAVAPWGWVGALWPAASRLTPWPVAFLCIAAIACWSCTSRLLNSLDGTRLLEQGERWQSASTAAVTGDFATALSGFRAKPTIGHTWAAVTKSNLFARFLLRDLLGALRTPGRFLVGTVSLVLAYTLSAIGFASTASLAWLPSTIGCVVAFLALGVLSDGFRHAAETAGTPPLYRYSTARLYLLHAILPTALSLGAAALGTAIATQLGAPIVCTWAVGAVSILLVIVRAYDSAKGPLPVSLLTPIPSPVGDPSGLAILCWQADALIIATAAGAAILLVALAGRDFSALGIAIVAAVALLALLRRRLSKL